MQLLKQAHTLHAFQKYWTNQANWPQKDFFFVRHMTKR